ncbi:orexin receptor type 2 [Cylas formicarius]|uniref:orexin receptor type 2 n=1 Tax=Cylas formicarius TaxID=197179 RepID=UPI002958760C|nr:orexin receptor type 2 [Cylas formicarius]
MGSGGSKIDDGNRTVVTDEALKSSPYNKPLYFWIILVITVVALVANLLAIKSILYRKTKRLQKTCIISLALSDILGVLIFALNYLDMLSKELMTWIYGESMCYFVPVGQILGSTASSVALFVIALDRYHNVFYALSKRWDPEWWLCLGGALILWGVCAAISYPMKTYYYYLPIIVNDKDEYLCTASPLTKNELALYYIITTIIVFLPICCMFLWLYYKIAILVWHHRKPVTSKSIYQSDDTSNTRDSDQSTTPNLKPILTKSKNVQVERKIRTFKIVLVLMFSFMGCRLPHAVYNIVRTASSVSGKWNLNNSLIALYMTNYALNPFLYTFLNQTINAWKRLSDFMCEVCFCCCSKSEFENFERENPFEKVQWPRQKPVAEEPRVSSSHRVKFADVNMPKYTPKERF